MSSVGSKRTAESWNHPFGIQSAADEGVCICGGGWVGVRGNLQAYDAAHY